MCHLDHNRKFPTKIIGCVNWILKSLEAAMTPNKSNHNPNIKYGETRMWTRIHKGNRGTWTSSTQQVREDPYVDQKTQKVVCWDTYKKWRRSNKKGETRKGGGARNWFQSTRTVTCSCERSRTSPSSRAWEKDRKSSSSRSISCRLAADWRLQPIQQKFEGDDPRIG